MALIYIGARFFEHHPLRPWQQSLGFAVASLLFAAAAIVLWGKPVFFLIAVLGSGLYAYSALGLMLGWPGFRGEREQEIDDCILTGNLRPFLMLLTKVIGYDLDLKECDAILQGVQDNDAKGRWFNCTLAGRHLTVLLELQLDGDAILVGGRIRGGKP